LHAIAGVKMQPSIQLITARLGSHHGKMQHCSSLVGGVSHGILQLQGELIIHSYMQEWGGGGRRALPYFRHNWNGGGMAPPTCMTEGLPPNLDHFQLISKPLDLYRSKVMPHYMLAPWIQSCQKHMSKWHHLFSCDQLASEVNNKMVIKSLLVGFYGLALKDAMVPGAPPPPNHCLEPPHITANLHAWSTCKPHDVKGEGGPGRLGR
jgi:hypothetical protein